MTSISPPFFLSFSPLSIFFIDASFASLGLETPSISISLSYSSPPFSIVINIAANLFDL